ncbi:MAG TPA: hypothetical protein VFT12_09830 [Thermoanaerobaculia bacterium]|nr:hypothetical protein [Thermoanaerobaculia bacterium]
MTKRLVVILAAAALAIGATSLVAQTAAPLTGEPLLRALLDELRTLRVSLQRNSAYELRGRFLIDRARLHQETIRELSREVEQNSDYLRSSEPMEVSYEMEMESMEARSAGIANPEERRKMIERHKEAMERRKEMEARHREQMRLRFQRMENRLAEEREKLRAIEEELAQIQTELTASTR